MSGLLISILISKCIYSNFDSMDAFRFHIDYVNSLILRLFITRRVAPADFSTGALARSVRGRFDHTAPPLIRLVEIPRCLHTLLAWETGNPSTNQGTVSSSALLVDFGGYPIYCR